MGMPVAEYGDGFAPFGEVQGGRRIPDFEGEEVSATKMSFTSGSNLEVSDAVFRMEEEVYFVVQARIANVNHKTNEKTGLMERVHTGKVIDVVALPPNFDLGGLRDKL